MQAVDTQLKALLEEQKVFSEKLQTLRKDELEAQDSLADLKRKMFETGRMISKSNIPGLPSEFKGIIKEAKVSIADVQKKLEEKPLNISSVYLFLEKAVSNTNKVFETSKELIEQMYLAEKVIQYGNRYRSSNIYIAESLKEAEELFRQYKYLEALETAASAIEKVDPGSMKNLEANLKKFIIKTRIDASFFSLALVVNGADDAGEDMSMCDVSPTFSSAISVSSNYVSIRNCIWQLVNKIIM